MIIDLHLHTRASDGAFTPSELLQLVAKEGIDVASITDHDSVSGIEEALEAGLEVGVEVIPGVELSAETQEKPLHFLGYFIEYNNPNLLSHLENLRKLRIERAEKMIKKLRNFRIELDLSEAMAQAGNGSLGRPHLAKIMIEKGYVKDYDEAFDKYIGDEAPCFVHKYFYTPEDVIQIIKEAKGIPVLAHPGTSHAEDKIPSYVKLGLKGLEVYYPLHTQSQIKRLTEIAHTFDLIITGGSDYHRPDYTKNILGASTTPPQELERLKYENRLIKNHEITK